MNAERLLQAFSMIGDDPARIQQLRQVAIALAISGKLRADASALSNEAMIAAVERVKKDLYKQGMITKPKHFEPVQQEDLPDNFPQSDRFVPLGSLARIEKGLTGIKQATPGPFPLVVTGAERSTSDHFDFDGAAAIVPLVSSTGHGHASLNRLHYQEGKFALGTILAAVFPYDPELISARFLFEYLSAFKDELLVARMTGTANVTLSVGRIAEIPVPLVEPATQKRLDDLMALLDRLEAARTAREATRDRLTAASLARLTESDADPADFPANARFTLATLPALTTRPDQIKPLRQTILNLAVRGKLVEQDPSDEPASELVKRFKAAKIAHKQATGDARNKLAPDADVASYPLDLPKGWAVQSFENLFLFIDYRGNTPPKTDSGVPLITAKNVRMGALNREPREYISEKTFKSWMTRGFPKIGDLFFTTEAPLANVCLNDIQEPFALAQRVICFQPYADVSTPYLMLALCGDVMQSLIDGQATGMTAKGIKAAKLKPLPIPLPPLAEQHRIVAKVDALMALCDRLEAALTTADTTRARLLEALLANALNPATMQEMEAAE